MNCRRFRRQYSEYRDGHDPELAAAMDDHMEVCPSCAAFDRAIQEGVNVLRGDRVLPSVGFMRRMTERLQAAGTFVDAPAPPQLSPWAATAAAALFLAMVGLSLKQLMMAPTPVAAEIQPMVIAQPSLHAGLPFVTFSRVPPDSTP